MVHFITVERGTIDELLRLLDQEWVGSVKKPVKVDWPEVQLTAAEAAANAAAMAKGDAPPHPDRSIVILQITR